MPGGLISEGRAERKWKGLTLWVFIVVEMDDFNWHAANTRVLSDLLSERRASKAGKEKGYGYFRERHGVIGAKDDCLLSLPWPGASSQYIFLYFSITTAEDVMLAALDLDRRLVWEGEDRLGNGTWRKYVDEIVRGWSAVSALLLGYLEVDIKVIAYC